MNYRLSGKVDNIVKLIKGVRILNGLGLKETKDIADKLRYDGIPIELRGVAYDAEAMSLIYDSGVNVLEIDTLQEVREKLDDAAIICIKNGEYGFATELLDLLKRV